MAKVKNRKLNPYLLWAVATLLLTAGWLMQSFPVFLLVGIAPLLAINDQIDETNIWNKSELIGVALAIAWWAARLFAWSALIPALLQAIAITLTFVILGFSRAALGQRLGKLPLLLFWLGLEYTLLKFSLGEQVTFLADGFLLQESWWRWTGVTGYLGISLWVLLSNWLFYLSFLQRGWNPLAFAGFVLVVAGPLAYSLTGNFSPIQRNDMLTFYAGTGPSPDVNYAEKGEWIPRTAAWVSVLIILFATVKNNITKK
jgi:hypothetical protein